MTEENTENAENAVAEPVRHRLDIALPQPVPAHDFRRAEKADVPALGELMWRAYRGTPDEKDAGDGVESATVEVRGTFEGVYGPFMPGASFVAEDEDGRPVAAALVTYWNGAPLLAFVYTAPTHTGRGLARRLIETVMHALGARGHKHLSLAVTTRNHRARALYESMGFADASAGRR